MPSENKLIQLIKDEQQRSAIEAMSRPPSDGKDVSFEFGRRLGYHAGLDKALDIILRSLKDDRDID